MPHKRRSSQPKTDQGMMRCVVDDGGNLVFASPALGWATGQSAIQLAGKPLHSILQVTSSLDSKHQDLDLKALQSGFYEVALLRETRDPMLLQARIDIVEAPEKKRLTVIWLDPDNKLSRQRHGDFNRAAREFALFINENQQKEGTGDTAQKADFSHISKADGELRHFLNLTNDLLGVSDGRF